MQTFYHGTAGRNVKKILKEGIKPTIGGAVWMTPDRSEALKYARMKAYSLISQKRLSDQEYSRKLGRTGAGLVTIRVPHGHAKQEVKGKVYTMRQIAVGSISSIRTYRSGDFTGGKRARPRAIILPGSKR